ncbi:MAG: DUF1800 domain-containing protein [Candidatus Eremiobacteraeota bacterium]|nr:DUF1800 domain-containing protein [Candidatus Eremiobacteraeota bacterium]
MDNGTRPAGQLDIATALSPYSGPWDVRMASHLMRRAGFGGTPQQVQQLSHMPMHEAVESLIHFPSTAGLPDPDNVFDPYQQGLIGAGMAGVSRVAQGIGLFGPGVGGARPIGMIDPQARQERAKELRQDARQSIISLQAWWLTRMVASPAPLQEKMTLLWHGHFTSAAIQKQAWPSDMYRQNQLFRQYALGNVRDLTQAVSKDVAMLKYLDGERNVKAHPNENYARELMELFTLGIGNYSEQDIRESARAFSGWTVDRRTGEFVDNQSQHDDGSKTFLGRTGNFTGTDIVNIIFQQPAASKFFAKFLLNNFVYNDPEPELVDAVAANIVRNDFNLAPVVSKLLQSNVFYSERSYRALVKSPVEFVVGTHQLFGLKDLAPNAQRALVQMGQILFYPPNVAGWPGGSTWITSQTLIARENFLAALMNMPMMQQTWLGEVPMNARAATAQMVSAILQSDISPASQARLQDYLNGAGTSALGMLSAENYEERVRGAAYLAMAMPAYQLS